ncbi:MAG: efflux RND transporter periplasmic adaptor subunit [Patescibacteria group bacterium]
MKKVVAYIQARMILSAVVGVVVVGGAVWFVFFSNGNGTEQTLVLEPRTLVQQVSVSGKVQAVDDVKLSFVQSGRIASIPVKVGSEVGRGALLASLDNADAQALVLQRKAALASQEAELQSLVEGTRPEEIAVSEAAVSSATVVVLQAELALIDALRDAQRAADNGVRVNTDQFISNPRTDPQLTFSVSNAQVRITAESGRRSVEAVLISLETLATSLTSSSDLTSAVVTTKSGLSAVSSFLLSASIAVSQGITNGSVTSTILEGYGTDVASARSSVNTATSAFTSAETALKNARASLESAEKSLLLKRAGATASTLAAQQADVDAARAQVLDAEAQLRKTYIIAPFSGVVTAIDAKLGEISTPSVPVISLISQNTLQIESFVPEINLALLEVGDPAVVTLDAYGTSVEFPASVVAVDPAETVRDGVSTYRALLAFNEDDERVRAGMTANIVITALTKDNVLMIPVGAVKKEGGVQTVLVKEGDAKVQKTVTTGVTSSFGDVEIVSGLSAGDVVILKE